MNIIYLVFWLKKFIVLLELKLGSNLVTLQHISLYLPSCITSCVSSVFGLSPECNPVSGSYPTRSAIRFAARITAPPYNKQTHISNNYKHIGPQSCALHKNAPYFSVKFPDFSVFCVKFPERKMLIHFSSGMMEPMNIIICIFILQTEVWRFDILVTNATVPPILRILLDVAENGSTWSLILTAVL